MKKGFALWVVLVALGQGPAGCGGSDASYNPVSPPPSPPTPPPAPPPSPKLVVDLTGNYTLTFEVGDDCEQIPNELRSRTYDATIAYHTSYGSTDAFLAYPGGATFRDQQPVFVEVTHSASRSSVWLNLIDTVILEEPESGAYFMVGGGDGGASVEPTELSTISTSFTGYFNYCVVSPQNQCSSNAMVHSMCKSEHSEWTLRRR